MNHYDFVKLPGNAAVATAMTLLVSAWFLVAAGAILTDNHSDVQVRAAETMHLTNVDPAARQTIVVEARRGDA